MIIFLGSPWDNKSGVMKLLVVGATGKTGEMAPSARRWPRAMRSWSLVALLSRDTRTIRSAKTQGDVLDSATVAAAVQCLGPVNLRDRVTLTQCAHNICKAMQPHMRQRFAPLAWEIRESLSHLTAIAARDFSVA
jgi:cobalamin biosynthesis protein CbiD